MSEVDDSEYDIRPFLIDDGQLKGIGRNECFVLGYELHVIDEWIRCVLLGLPSELRERTVHVHNRERIQWKLDAWKIRHRWVWMEADASEEWIRLVLLGPEER